LSSVGVDRNKQYSKLTGTNAGGGWYSHIKGKLEYDVERLNFKSLCIFKPAGI